MKRVEKPGNAKQRKAINKLASAGHMRDAVEMLKLIDPGAHKIRIRSATRDNLKQRY